jgi:hypothetical protein
MLSDVVMVIVQFIGSHWYRLLASCALKDKEWKSVFIFDIKELLHSTA